MTVSKCLSIILPSYNDIRIGAAIQSIQYFDDNNSVKIIVVDGGSNESTKQIIQSYLSADDIFISEPDNGIFDALNKGLDVCDTDYIGWLGSDDLFTGKVRASEVIGRLENCDLFVGNINFFNNGFVTRRTHAWPSRIGLMRLGLHNPHYATFGLASLLKSEKFDLKYRGSDIEYFIKIFDKKPRIMSTSKVITLQGEGGFSNNSFKDILQTNLEIMSMFGVLGPVAVLIKLIYKSLSKIYFKIFLRKISYDFSMDKLNCENTCN